MNTTSEALHKWNELAETPEARALLSKVEAGELTGGVAVNIAVQPTAKTKTLITYTADTLYGQEFERPPFVVDGFLPAGLAILAGAPKRGKSWMALWLSVCVAGGTDFLGMRCSKGDVLYLDLESRQYRVADRLGLLMVGPAPAGLHVAHDAACIGDGLVGQLAEWCDNVGLPRLIVIDTFQRVKPPARRVENAYESDYRILDGVQRFAMDRGVAVLLVHHLRKAGYSANADPLEKISGSMGISGSCDTIYMLDGERESKDATLYVEGRDVERASLVVRFESGVWTCLGADSTAYNEQRDYRESPVVRSLLSLFVERQRWEGTPTALIDSLFEVSVDMPGDITPEQLGKELSKHEKLLSREGIVIARRRVKVGKNKTVRHLMITKDAQDEEFDL